MATKTSLLCDAAADEVAVPGHADLDGSTVSVRTIEVWMKTGTDVATTQVVYEEGGGSGGFNLYIRGGELFANAWSSTSVSVGSCQAPISASTVYHVAFVFDQPSNVSRLYVDGVLADTGVASGTVGAHQGGQVRLGNNNGTTRDIAMATIAAGSGFQFNGHTAHLRVWNAVRTQAEIDANKYADLTGSETGLVLVYNFNTGSGTVADDLTSRNLDGTITGPTWSSFEYDAGGTPVEISAASGAAPGAASIVQVERELSGAAGAAPGSAADLEVSRVLGAAAGGAGGGASGVEVSRLLSGTSGAAGGGAGALEVARLVAGASGAADGSAASLEIARLVAAASGAAGGGAAEIAAVSAVLISAASGGAGGCAAQPQIARLLFASSGGAGGASALAEVMRLLSASSGSAGGGATLAEVARLLSGVSGAGGGGAAEVSTVRIVLISGATGGAGGAQGGLLVARHLGGAGGAASDAAALISIMREIAAASGAEGDGAAALVVGLVSLGHATALVTVEDVAGASVSVERGSFAGLSGDPLELEEKPRASVSVE